MEPEKPCRLIYSLKLDIEPPPGSGPTASSQLIVPLNRDGTGHRGEHGTGTPRPPKTRAIDLRVGDHVMVKGQWRKVLAISAYREHRLTEERAKSRPLGDGYLVRPKANC